MKKLFIILAAIAMVGAFAATTMAAEWGFYGSSRLQTWYESANKDATGTGDSESTLYWNQQGNSRIGARVKASDAISGNFEAGFGDGRTSPDTKGLSDRLLYGTWHYSDSGALVIGQAYTPVSYWVGAQVYGQDTGLIGYGAPYGGRQDQMKWKSSMFQVALIQNAGADGDYNNYLPKLEARVDIPLGSMRLGVFGGYQTYEDAAEEDVSSYLGGVGFSGAFGAFWFDSAIHGGTNMSNAGWANGGGAVAGGGEDATALAFAVALGVATSETMKFEGGLGYTQAENDDLGTKTDTNMALYLNLTYTFAPGFFVVPEIGYVDMMKGFADEDQGNMMYAGAKWQINF